MQDIENKSIDLSKAQNGDLIFVRDKNLISALIQNTEGDFDWSHVCSIWKIEGIWKILTTGAYWDWKQFAYVYGMVDAVDYLYTRQFCLGRRTDLTLDMQKVRLDILLDLAKKQVPYAIGKVLFLALKGRLTFGVVNHLYHPPELNPKKFFCSEIETYGIVNAKAVFMPYTQALSTINVKYPFKSEPSVFTPEVLYNSSDTLIL